MDPTAEDRPAEITAVPDEGRGRMPAEGVEILVASADDRGSGRTGAVAEKVAPVPRGAVPLGRPDVLELRSRCDDEATTDDEIAAGAERETAVPAVGPVEVEMSAALEFVRA